jgi:hypothetical protein
MECATSRPGYEGSVIEYKGYVKKWIDENLKEVL